MTQPTTEERWRGRPVLSWLLRMAIVVAPIAASVAVAAVVGRSLPRSTGVSGVIVWWALVLGTSTGTLVLADRLTRRLLPLAALLRMTLLFPDRAPSRLAVARKSGTTRGLERRLQDAHDRGVEDEPTKAAVTILGLATSLSDHDRGTRGHSERVRALTDLIAEELKLPVADRDRLRWSALLHDVGKLTVHPEVLNKPGKLSEDEWAVIHRHPLEGARLAGPLLPWLGEWAKTIEQHHERYDGEGYPYRLAGQEISLGGRIVAVADSFDTMTAARSYSPAMSAEAARRELARCSGTQFDPAVVRAFLNVSLGRLRWAAGPLAWLAQLPFANGFARVGDLLVVGSRALAGTAAVTVGASVAGAGAPPAANGQTQAPGTAKAAATLTSRTQPRLPQPAPPAPRAPVAPPPADPPPPAPDPTPPTTAPRPPVTPSPTAHPRPTTPRPPASAPATPQPAAPVPAPPPVGPTPADPAPPAPSPSPAPAGPPPPAPAAPPTSPTPPIPAAPPPPPVVPPTPTPIAVADTATTPAGTAVTIPVLANDSGWTGTLDPTSVQVVSPPLHGSTTVAPTGTVTYTPAAGFTGVDTFVYRVCDTSGGGCSTASVSATVTPIDLPPVAAADTAVVVKTTTTAINVLSNDTDDDGDLAPASLSVVTAPTKGSATVSSDRTIAYTAGQPGIDTFTYRVCDQLGLCSTAPVTVTVLNSIDQGPKVLPTFALTTSGRPVKIDVLANVSPSDPLAPIAPATLAIDTLPAHGTVVVNADHTITYTPASGFIGLDNFKYAISDSLGASAKGNVQVVSG